MMDCRSGLVLTLFCLRESVRLIYNDACVNYGCTAFPLTHVFQSSLYILSTSRGSYLLFAEVAFGLVYKMHV